MVSFRIDEDDFSRLDTFAQQTSCSRAEVLRRLSRTARLESTVDAQAMTGVSRLHADLNRIGGLLKLAIRDGAGVCLENFGDNDRGIARLSTRFLATRADVLECLD